MMAEGTCAQPHCAALAQPSSNGRIPGVNVADVPYPGADLIRRGLDDWRGGRESVPALLVQVGAPRLRRLGIALPEDAAVAPEHRLYALLSAERSDAAHARYNALIRRLVSFERAAACGA